MRIRIALIPGLKENPMKVFTFNIPNLHISSQKQISIREFIVAYYHILVHKSWSSAISITPSSKSDNNCG